MAPSTKLEDKLEGLEKFLAWKYRIGLILIENVREEYIKDEMQNQLNLKLRRSMNKP